MRGLKRADHKLFITPVIVTCRRPDREMNHRSGRRPGLSIWQPLSPTVGRARLRAIPRSALSAVRLPVSPSELDGHGDCR